MRRALAVLIVGGVMALPSAAQAATYTVTNAVDTAGNCDGDPANCSLRQAINSANGNAGADTVVVDTATYPVTLAALLVTDEVRIEAAGPGRPEIDGLGARRIFQATAPLTLEGLDLVNGYNGGGGAAGGTIETSDDLVLDDVVISASIADGSSSARGGAISSTGNSLTIVDSVLDGNTATASGGASQGGAIGAVSATTVSIVDTVFRNNVSEGPTGALGGALHTDADVTMTRVELDLNLASSTGGSAGGGAVSATGSSLVVVDGELTDNDATTTAVQDAEGGAIRFAGDDLTVTGSTLSGNGATSAGLAAQGGAVAHASGGPGANATFVTTTIEGNTATGGDAHGAGIYGFFVPVSLVGSTVASNTASASVGRALGGGTMLIGGPLSTTNSTLFGNAVVVAGGGIEAVGGAVFANGGGNSTLSATTVTANQAFGPGARGGGLASGTTPVAFDLTGSVVSGNDQPAADADCADAALTSGGGNVVNQTSGVTGCTYTPDATDAVTDDPQLAGLSSYGGPTRTALPLSGSVVLNRYTTGCPATDQRGVSRPQGPACDAGAVELRPPTFVPVPTGLVFGAQDVGTTSAGQDVTVTNEGDETGTPALATGGANPGDFALSGCAGPVFPGFDCTLSVTFAPTAGGGRSASVTGLDSAVALSGTGVAAPASGGPIPQCDELEATTPYETAVPFMLRCSAMVWSWEVVTAPEHGRVGAIDDQGRVTYTPDRGFSGFDVFRYRALGPGGASEPAIVRIAVGEGPPEVVPPRVPSVSPLCASMPRLVGRTMKGVRRALRRTGCADVPRTVARRGKRGKGDPPRRVVRQTPDAGSVIAAGGRISLVLRPKR